MIYINFKHHCRRCLDHNNLIGKLIKPVSLHGINYIIFMLSSVK